MGMSFLYGPTDDAENMRVLHRYLDLGGNFLDTAEMYGPYTNEELLGRFLKEIPRESVVVATKFGFRLENGGRTGIDSSPANERVGLIKVAQRPSTRNSAYLYSLAVNLAWRLTLPSAIFG